MHFAAHRQNITFVAAELVYFSMLFASAAILRRRSAIRSWCGLVSSAAARGVREDDVARDEAMSWRVRLLPKTRRYSFRASASLTTAVSSLRVSACDAHGDAGS